MKTGNKKRFVISVLIRDRVGILRDITTAVTNMGANIDGISQTVVAGYFTVTLTATFTGRRQSDEIRKRVMENFIKDEISAVVRPYEGLPAVRQAVDGDSYIVIITGKDRGGILKAITSFMASKGINIEDWQVEFDGADVRHIGEITVPAILDIKQMQDEFRGLLAPMALTCCLQHENIFRATNEIGPIKSLLGEK
jgi:glycine cleavage system transcriptional repressor